MLSASAAILPTVEINITQCINTSHGTYNPEDERFSDARPGLMEIAVGLKNDDPYLINENIDLSSCLICGGK